MLFGRQSKNTILAKSISGYNHISQEQHEATFGTMKGILDTETGLIFKKIGGGPTVNTHRLEEFEPEYHKRNGDALIGTGTHEQYFYSDYYAYQPDTAEKILKMAEVMHSLGYTYITADELEIEMEVLEWEKKL